MASSEKNAPAVGIDLGTTYSVIARLNDLGDPETIRNDEGELITPSVVLLDDDEIIVGREAAKAISTDLDRVAHCAKRQVGQRFFDKKFFDRRFPPEAIQGWILKKLKDDAERSIGTFNHAVITVPAYFDEIRRKSTQDAGYIAGLGVLDIINEPTAAAIAFGHQQNLLDEQGRASKPLNILVYDLGGGTFDVTVMRIEREKFDTVATDGDIQLGGQDWDNRLVDCLAEDFIRKFGNDPREDTETLGQMLRDVKDAKETLSARKKVTLKCSMEGCSTKLEITREQFEEQTADLLERTAFTTRQTLKEAKLKWDELDHILLVGGSTRMPQVPQMLKSLSGLEPDCTLSPDEAVAHGAAIHAGVLLKQKSAGKLSPKIRNVNSHSLGVVANDVETKVAHVVKIIPRNTPIPVVAKRVFKTHRDAQESILVKIVEGESEFPDDCAVVGQCSIWDIPEDLPVDTPIEVRFGYKENGRLAVQVQVGDNEPFQQEIDRPNSLTQEQLDSWRDYLAD